jgi:hypothetical protein
LSRAAVLLLVAGFVGYGLFLAWHGGSYAGGADSSGYLNSARLLGEGRLSGTPRAPDGWPHTAFGLMAFQPLGFTTDATEPRLTPTYPTGLPLHLLAASWLVGWRHAATLVNIFAALGAGAILWSLARRLQLGPGWAAAALGLFWLCPLTLFTALQPLSDLLALFWSLAALWLALRSPGHWRWALLTGVATSIAVLVRPTNVLLALPLAVALGTDLRRHLLLGLGGLPAAAFFCYYNWRAYGAPLATGYGDVWNVFGLVNVSPNLVHFARWIPALLTPLILAALAAPFLPATRRRELAVLGLWAGLLIGFYACYYHSGETWWYLRFILPAFPVLILAALVVLQHAWRRRPPSLATRLALAVVAAATAAWQIRLSDRLDAVGITAGEADYLHGANWAQGQLPPEAAVFCMQTSGALYFYTPLLLIRWDQVEMAELPRLLATLQAGRRPVYAMLFEFEQAEAFARLGGRWKKIATVGPNTFWQLETTAIAP